jgi:hypothetical protein
VAENENIDQFIEKASTNINNSVIVYANRCIWSKCSNMVSKTIPIKNCCSSKSRFLQELFVECLYSRVFDSSENKEQLAGVKDANLSMNKFFRIVTYILKLS